MVFNGDFRIAKIATSGFFVCSICDDSVCDTCFISNIRTCGQCAEAATNGLKNEMDILNINILDAAESKNPYIRRRIERILTTILKDVFKREKL